MKTLLQWQFAFIAGLLLFVNNSFAQITYSECFESLTSAWSEDEFFPADTLACTGDIAFVGESYNIFGIFNVTATSQALVGTSSGQPATLTFNYKLIDYYTVDALSNSTDWGLVRLAYASSESGPWTTIETITQANHTESAACAAKTVSFTPPRGALYLQMYVQANTSLPDMDFYFFVDDIAVTQAASPDCNGTPAASAAVAASASICNSQDASLTLSPVYLFSGLTFQWQSSPDNVTFTNVATGGTADTYQAAQTEDTWYRAIITCTASGESVTSAPVQIVNSGLECPCDVAFESNIEPITHVLFAGIDNESSPTLNGTPGREDFTALSPAEVTQGSSYPIALEGNTDGDFINFFTVFIDFNQNGDFSDEGETFEIGSIEFSTGVDGQQATGTIAIPMDAATGLTNMRVFKLYGESTTEACETEDGFGYGQVEDYLINISEFVAGTDAFSANNFKYYPNPVTNILNVSFVKNITGIEVYNLLGQTVLHKNVDQNTAQINMSSLSAGTYMVKVATEGATKTIKVIKQ